MLMQQVLIDGAERTPGRLALHWVDRDVALTYKQAVLRMEHMAGALASLGVGKGDRVTIFAHNGMDYLLAMFGAWRSAPSPPSSTCSLPPSSTAILPITPHRW